MSKKISLSMVYLMLLSLLAMFGCSGPTMPSEQSAKGMSPITGDNTHTVTLQPGPDDGKDALLHGLPSVANTNMGDSTQLPAAAWTFSGTPGNVRSVLGFDLSFIPTGSTINSAYLSLYAWDQTGGIGQHSTLSGSNATWLQRITSSWDEHTVTWNNQPSTTTVNQVSLPATTSPTQNFLNVDVTAMTQDMINDPSAGYAMMLRLQNEAYYRRVNFCSSDHSNSALRPTLVVTYTTAQLKSTNSGYLAGPGVVNITNCVVGSPFGTSIQLQNLSFDAITWIVTLDSIVGDYRPEDAGSIYFTPTVFNTDEYGDNGAFGYNERFGITMNGNAPPFPTSNLDFIVRIADANDPTDFRLFA